MKKILSKVFTIPDEPMGAEPVKIIAFAMTMWVTMLVVLFMLVPQVYGITATKPKLIRAFGMMTLPLMMASGLTGVNSKSQSLAVLLIRAFVTAFAVSLVGSLFVLID